jgi:hypothetical protein
MELLSGHTVTPGEHLARRGVKEILQHRSGHILEGRVFIEEVPLPREPQSALSGKRYARQRVSQVIGQVPDKPRREAVLDEYLSAGRVVDEGAVGAQDHPLLANEINKVAEPPGWSCGHEHDLYARSFGRSQSGPRPI